MENTSGMVIVDDRVLIKPEMVEEKTKGGIILCDLSKEKEQMAQVYGWIVDFGGNAFADFQPPIPQRGDRVLFAKNAGMRNIKGPADGEEYWMINDRDILAIIDKE